MVQCVSKTRRTSEVEGFLARQPQPFADAKDQPPNYGEYVCSSDRSPEKGRLKTKCQVLQSAT
jgi:hypothetical protein